MSNGGAYASRWPMTKLEKIEEAVSKLSPEEISAFADWFADFHAKLWDEQFERDVKAGKLDKLADAAIAHHKAGRTTPL